MIKDRPVLGIDLGTMTLAAGYAIPGEEPEILTMPIRNRNTPFHNSKLPISADGEVCRPDHQGQVEATVGNLTRHLGRPPCIIAGQPYGMHTLINKMMAPAIDAANKLPARPDMIAAVVPSHWPSYIIESYTKALESTGMLVSTVFATEAIAAYAETLEHDGIITCLDMGAQAATLTLALPHGDGRRAEVSEARIKGGLNHVAQQVVIHIAARRAPTFKPNDQWMKQAAEAGRRLLRATEKAASADTAIVATLPAPVGKIQVPAGQVSDLVEDLVSTALDYLSDNQAVKDLWNDDDEAGVTKKLLVAGGFSRSRAVGRAIRASLGRYRAHPHPENVLAMGAARFIAEERHL